MPDFTEHLQIVLYEPEIPPNTGNVIRLAANTGAGLHLVEPLGFQLEEKALRRAGLDYRESARVQVHRSLAACLEMLRRPDRALRVFAMTTKGSVAHHAIDYEPGDVLLFGPESRGLPETVLTSPQISARVRIPMQSGSRSLNLSNSVAVITYEALRQQGFPGLV